MEVSQTSAPEASSSQTSSDSAPTGAVETTSSAPSAISTEASSTPDAASIPEVPEVPAYQPNFKFSVMKKEHEIPEAYRQLIKDPQTEKQVKEIFEKAYGIDHVKGERAKLQEEYKSYRSQTEPVMQIAQQLQHHLQNNDLTSYFKTLGLTKQQVYQWAVKQAEIDELPEHQRQVYDQHQEAQHRAYQLEQQLQAQQAQFEQFQVQQRSSELESILSRPDISSFVQSFDQRNGEGAFRSEVIARGQLYYYTKGIDASPQQVVQEIMQRFGPNQSQAAAPQAPTMNAPQTKAPPQVPVIPNTGAGTSAPTQRSINSVDDMIAVRKQKFGF